MEGHFHFELMCDDLTGEYPICGKVTTPERKFTINDKEKVYFYEYTFTPQLMEAVHSLVADDKELQDLVAAWSLEIRGKEAADFLEWDINQYEAARKRLVRRLNTINKE